MARLKDKYGLDIPVPKPPAGKQGYSKGRIKVGVPKGYKAGQKPGLYKRIKARARKKKKKLFAKYEGPSLYSKIYDAHKQKLLGVITKFMTDELGVVVEWLKDMTNVRRKVRKTMNYHALLTAGLVVLLFGIAKYAECVCTTLLCGMGYLIVGLAAIIVALIYRRYS